MQKPMHAHSPPSGSWDRLEHQARVLEDLLVVDLAD